MDWNLSKFATVLLYDDIDDIDFWKQKNPVYQIQKEIKKKPTT